MDKVKFLIISELTKGKTTLEIEKIIAKYQQTEEIC